MRSLTPWNNNILDDVVYATESTQTKSTVPSPGLYLAIFDQKFELQEAIDLDQTRLIDINALGTSSINLEVEYRTNGTQNNFYYHPTITSIPDMGIVCNTSARDPSETAFEPCTTFLYLRIPGTTRVDVQVQNALNWVGLIQAAGAFYSLIQILAWVISCAAFDPYEGRDLILRHAQRQAAGAAIALIADGLQRAAEHRRQAVCGAVQEIANVLQKVAGVPPQAAGAPPQAAGAPPQAIGAVIQQLTADLQQIADGGLQHPRGQ